jgi:hypothetical protein
MTADLDAENLASLTVIVQEHRPSRWAWHLRDTRDGSWFESEYEFTSPMAARRAGVARLAELTPPVGVAAETSGPCTGRSRHLVIVSGDDAVYGLLRQVFAKNEGIEVIRDRRRPDAPVDRRETPRRVTADRRRRAPTLDRRRSDRRLTERRTVIVDAMTRARGWWMVCVSGVCDHSTALDRSA